MKKFLTWSLNFRGGGRETIGYSHTLTHTQTRAHIGYN